MLINTEDDIEGTSEDKAVLFYNSRLKKLTTLLYVLLGVDIVVCVVLYCVQGKLVLLDWFVVW